MFILFIAFALKLLPSRYLKKGVLILAGEEAEIIPKEPGQVMLPRDWCKLLH